MAPQGRGTGLRAYIPSDEVHAYATDPDPLAAVARVQTEAGRPVVYKARQEAGK